MIKLHLLNIANDFNTGQVKLVNKAFDKTLDTVSGLIEVDKVDVVVYHNPAYVIPETGIGGSTPTTHFINIPVDATHKLEFDDLYLAICHELHHAVRQRKFGFPSTLFDAVISEGLADQFEVEIDPKRRPITYREDIDKKTLLKGFDDLKRQMKNTDYDYTGWFFGSGDYPNWLGYTLGNMIVETYIKGSGEKPSKLVESKTTSFLGAMETTVAALK